MVGRYMFSGPEGDSGHTAPDNNDIFAPEPLPSPEEQN
jgi:hypothetical protein